MAHPICAIVLRLNAGRLFRVVPVTLSDLIDEVNLAKAIVGVGVAAAVGGRTMCELKGSQLVSRTVKSSPAFFRSYNQLGDPVGRTKQAGFSLMELMIVVAIIGILAAIAYPSYQQHIQRNKRVAAQEFMMLISSRQEQYLLDRRQYSNSVTALGLTSPAEVSPNFDITITPVNSNTPPTYTITASPKGSMAGTATLTLDSLGQKTPADKW